MMIYLILIMTPVHRKLFFNDKKKRLIIKNP